MGGELEWIQGRGGHSSLDFVKTLTCQQPSQSASLVCKGIAQYEAKPTDKEVNLP